MMQDNGTRARHHVRRPPFTMREAHHATQPVSLASATAAHCTSLAQSVKKPRAPSPAAPPGVLCNIKFFATRPTAAHTREDNVTWLRRLRAAAGMGFAWGLAWFGAGMVLLLIVGPGAADVPFPLGFGFLGFLAGAAFSMILGLVERGREFRRLSLARFAAWGAAGGFLFSVAFALVVTLSGSAALLDDLVFLGPLFAAAGAASAASALALARRGEDRPLVGTASREAPRGRIEG